MTDKDAIAKHAYFLWAEEGRLDGEEIVDTINYHLDVGPMKRRDYHWLIAENYINDLAAFRSGFAPYTGEIDTGNLESDLVQILQADRISEHFTPHIFGSREADCVTVIFKGDPDYSTRLSEHLTIYRSLLTDEIVGCRLKGIGRVLRELSFVAPMDRHVRLTFVLHAYKPLSETKKEERIITELMKMAREHSFMLKHWESLLAD